MLEEVGCPGGAWSLISTANVVRNHEGSDRCSRIDQQQYLQGYYAIYTMYLFNKYGLTPNIDTGGYLITKDNLGLIEELSGTYR